MHGMKCIDSIIWAQYFIICGWHGTNSVASFTGDQLIEREKQRLHELRRRANNEAVSLWEERRRCESASAIMMANQGSPQHTPLFYNSDSQAYFSDCASVSSFESIEGRLDGSGYSAHSSPIRNFSGSTG